MSIQLYGVYAHDPWVTKTKKRHPKPQPHFTRHDRQPGKRLSRCYPTPLCKPTPCKRFYCCSSTTTPHGCCSLPYMMLAIHCLIFAVYSPISPWAIGMWTSTSRWRIWETGQMKNWAPLASCSQNIFSGKDLRQCQQRKPQQCVPPGGPE